MFLGLNFENYLLGFIPMFGDFPIPTPWGLKLIPIGTLSNILLVVILFMIYFSVLKNIKYYKNGFMKKATVYLIGGKMGDGKTRFLNKIFKDIKEYYGKTTIICANFFNGYTDVYFSSVDDFFRLQKDIQILGLYLNFSEEEKDEIQKKFKGYFKIDDELKKFSMSLFKIKEFFNGKGINIVTGADEFHNYLHNRSAMANFSGKEGRKRLEILHQTRHSNQLLLLATQDTDTIDLDLRQIADKEIEVKEWLLGTFYGFNLYYYLNLKYQNVKENLFFHKINKLPFFYFNGYLFYEFTEFINWKIDILQKFIFKYINKYLKKNLWKTYQLKNYFTGYKLDYNTKFNVNTSIDIYKSGDIFKIIMKKFDI